MRERLRSSGIGGLAPIFSVAFAFLAAGCGGPDVSADDRPDVVLVVIDTLRPDHLGLHGYERETAPFLARLGSESVVFERAFSTSGWTPPAIASVLTGLYPSTHGLVSGVEANATARGRVERGEEVEVELTTLPADHATLTERLRDDGYRTFGIVTNANANAETGFPRGFERYRTWDLADAEAVMENLEEWEDEIRSSEPYFLFLHFMDVHQPLDAREPWYEEREGPLGDLVGRYDSEIRYLDGWLERMFERFGWEDEAIVCLVSDHGEAFDEHGLVGHGPDLHAEINRVLFVVHAPEVEPRVVRTNVSLVDVLPTIAELAGLPVEDAVEGRSLVPLFSSGGTDEVGERLLFAHRRKRDPGEAIWMVVRGRWKLVHDDAERSWLLYDTVADPRETNDLWDERPPVAEELRAILEAYRDAGIRRAGETVRVKLDAELVHTLQELGYVDADEPAPASGEQRSDESPAEPPR